MLVLDLLTDGYQFVLTRRLQSDRLENRFLQYRQMSGGSFLVGLREVLCSEKILKCRSHLKAGIEFLIQDDLKPPQISPIIPEAIFPQES